MTSIEWLIEKLGWNNRSDAINRIVDEAKEMHYKELNKVSEDWWTEGASYMYDGKREYNSFEQYYNETFKND